ncbi:Crooked neck-like protein 1 [Orchesella cincta]|uniref:Crooked neck-like protein 1 n=1 Tax=Orchesella cincta TaxID=48709 RepID=A0A1D2MYD0_ORCCI|nr:Crooked neck-like protein 1 [Orchesella cincta]
MEQATAGKAQRVPKVAKVKNKAPAEIQITAEQLLREAKERDLEIVPPPPKQKISDPEELADYRLRKRKAFEDNIRKNRLVVVNWLKYSKWEESQGEIQRARSVYERALDVDHRNPTLWLRYAEMEMRCRQVNHARNLWDRAVTIMPRVSQFWYKYTYMEEMLGNIAGGAVKFERVGWSGHPDEQAWQTYVNFELRYKEIDRARAIYEKFVYTHPDVKHWIKYARFEEKHGFIRSARQVYERAVDFYGEEYMDERLFIAFAKFEENQREHERARVIYKYALNTWLKKVSRFTTAYTIHEKKYGDRVGIENVILSKRKFQYEEAIQDNPYDYDTWFDYCKLLENAEEVDVSATRDVYERAIAQIPPSKEKTYWRRYIYLWIKYALFEELDVGDMDKARMVYKNCLELIPHKVFTFAKIWLLEWHSVFVPKTNIRGYIELEIHLREFDRCRILYEKFLEFGPENCTTWMKFAELEYILSDLNV